VQTILFESKKDLDRMKRSMLVASVAVTALVCSSLTYFVTQHEIGSTSQHADGTQVRWITLTQLERSLPKGPIHVVFDVDDTALFTSAAFQWGTRTYGKDIVSAGVSIREEDLKSEEARQKFREFWTKLNNELDQYSVKKWIANELIQLHKRRGDRIYFVTKRINTGSEQLTPLLKETFDLPDLAPVIFTQRRPKIESFKEIQAVISCGDSDSDIHDSIEAGARPIRVMRARTSVNVEPVHNGAYGEEVLVNSEF
jgi:acid phosphatase (class B)